MACSDATVPPHHAELYAAAIPQARIHLLAARDHQLNDNGAARDGNLEEVAAVIAGQD